MDCRPHCDAGPSAAGAKLQPPCHSIFFLFGRPGTGSIPARSAFHREPEIQHRAEPAIGLGAPPGARRYGWLPGPPWLLQEAGRSEFLPVHWPDLPAPLPPSVGGDGLAPANGAAVTASATVDRATANTLRVRVMPEASLLRCDRLSTPTATYWAPCKNRPANHPPRRAVQKRVQPLVVRPYGGKSAQIAISCVRRPTSRGIEIWMCACACTPARPRLRDDSFSSERACALRSPKRLQPRGRRRPGRQGEQFRSPRMEQRTAGFESLSASASPSGSQCSSCRPCRRRRR